jgi:ubiquinone/menaquinone biosynthesis C-methylase UbiE
VDFETTRDPAQVLGHVSGGRVLDAATGDGKFIQFLLDGLRDHAEIVGIDSAPVEGPLFEERFRGQAAIRFELMDLEQPRFPEATFDTVSLANSICMFDEPREVLVRLGRLLRPGGHLIVSADYRDFQVDSAMTYVELHDWWAAVDRVLGKVHRPSLRRDELASLLSSLELEDLRLFNLEVSAGDPLDPGVLATIDGVISRSIAKVDGHPDLQQRGEILRARLRTVGFRVANTLIAVGRTPYTPFPNAPMD